MGIAENLARVTTRVRAAAEASGRDPAAVTVLAAVKTQTVQAVIESLDAGVTLIGHNRAQELVQLDAELAAHGRGGVHTHFIGALQTNKVNKVVPLVDCVQSVDRWELAQRLDHAAAHTGRVLDVLVQVNASGEPTKSGVRPDDAVSFAQQVAALPALRLRGLMTIGAHSPDPAVVDASFAVMQQLSWELGRVGLDAGELSMGMSGDLESAVAHGATIVRVGTGVFGPRA